MEEEVPDMGVETIEQGRRGGVARYWQSFSWSYAVVCWSIGIVEMLHNWRRNNQGNRTEQ